MRCLIAAAFVCALLAAPEHARAQTPKPIGFENLPVGTRVDTQYLRLGLRVVSRAAIDSAPRAHGGRQLLVALSPPPTMVAVAAAAPVMVLGFARPQSFVRLFLSGRAQPGGRLFGTVEALDAAGARVAVDGPRSVDPRAAIVAFTVATKEDRISFVRVAVIDSTPNGARAAGVAIDDLEFGVTPPPLPQVPPQPPPQPPPLVRVPDLFGLTSAAAAERLKRSGLVLGGTRDVITDKAKANTIVDQVPARGSPAKPGASVTVSVARPPPSPPPRPTSPRPPLVLILAIVVGLGVVGVLVHQALRRLRWRVKTRVHTGLEALHPRVTAPREATLEIRLVPVPSSGTQQLRKGP